MKIIQTRPAGDNHEVISYEAQDRRYMKKPCPDCPWRKDAVGEFPAEAFRHSAVTAYDMSQRNFSCHTSGIEKPAICAGYLLNGSYHNLAARVGRLTGEILEDVTDGGHDLFESYRQMAIANGVEEDDPVLAPCRSAKD